MKKRKWYNNGIIQKLTTEAPDLAIWKEGRLPISEETRQKHISNNGMHNMTKEQIEARSLKISKARKEATVEQKEEISKNISKGRKGKGKGKNPWNKGLKGVQEAWNKNISCSEEQKEKIRNKWTKERKQKIANLCSERFKNTEPWNKGISISYSEEFIKERARKNNETKAQNNTFNTSKPEDIYYNYLLTKYNKEDIIRQYQDSRYPYACDFYIKSLDKFIELNLHWTHGGRLYDENDLECKEQLNRWGEKAKSSEFYKNAIHTWTILDVKKYNIAKKNNLNYEVIYKEDPAWMK